MECRYGKCTRPCANQGECPVGFDCGLQKPEDATVNGLGATCYKPTYEMPPMMGGFGTDCSLVGADPNTGSACDPKATSPCATGFVCRATTHCDPNAYCTKACTADSDCPPFMFCGLETSKPNCKTDTDCPSTMKCTTAPGTNGKVNMCVGPQLCRKRAQCSGCGNDDQCPTGYVCAADANGERFCGKMCTMDEHCPQPENDAPLSPVSGPFMKCVASGTANPSMVCRPVAGTCHGPSALAPLATVMNTVCSACRPGLPSDCPDGFCFQQNFSEEHFCTQPCTAHVVKNQDGSLTITKDSCPMGATCFARPVCANCDVKGLCAGDTNPGTPQSQSTYYTLTCYPM